MHPAKVIGHVVASQKDESLLGVRLLLIQPTDWEGNPIDDYVVAADSVGAGFDEMVFFVESREAAVAFPAIPPIDAGVVAIIDGVNLDPDYYGR